MLHHLAAVRYLKDIEETPKFNGRLEDNAEKCRRVKDRHSLVSLKTLG